MDSNRCVASVERNGFKVACGVCVWDQSCWCVLQRDKQRLSDVYTPIHVSIHTRLLDMGGGKQAAVAKAVEEPHAVSLIECMDLPTTSIQLVMDSHDCLKEADTLLAGVSGKGSCAVHTYIHM